MSTKSIKADANPKKKPLNQEPSNFNFDHSREQAQFKSKEIFEETKRAHRKIWKIIGQVSDIFKNITELPIDHLHKLSAVILPRLTESNVSNSIQGPQRRSGANRRNRGPLIDDFVLEELEKELIGEGKEEI